MVGVSASKSGCWLSAAEAAREDAVFRAKRRKTRCFVGRGGLFLGSGMMLSLVGELWQFMKVRKKFWLLPVLVAMGVFGGLTVLTKGSAVAPFIYTLF